MAQPDTQRREQILDAAIQAFAQNGYSGTSIKQIARQAGLKSTSHIYWYFSDKRALLSAAISERSPLRALNLFDETMQAQLLALPPRAFITLIGETMLTLQDDSQAVALMRLYLSEAFRDPEVAEAVRGFQDLAANFMERYLQHQVENGALRPHDVRISARMLVGSVVIRLMAEQVFQHMASGFPPRDVYIEGLIETMLNGIGPENSS